uniref:Uncharacterized protein n=1 Tax=Octopus bimaculoides TaxID=37653 RepID=A0A0L8GSN8_OCTBM
MELYQRLILRFHSLVHMIPKHLLRLQSDILQWNSYKEVFPAMCLLLYNIHLQLCDLLSVSCLWCILSLFFHQSEVSCLISAYF